MRTEIQFRELLLSGLREDRKPLETLFQEDVNWALIKEKSDMHAVSGIVFDAVLKLPDSLKPQKLFFLTWFGNVAQIEKSNKFLDDSLKQLKAYFDTGNISFVVLKGQPISRLYNIPEHRQCGDIDIVTKQEHFHSANELLMQYSEPPDTAYKKHSQYTQ